MLTPPIPADETKRVQALRDLNILDTPTEDRFDRLTRIAQHILQVPIALVSLVDTDRQWFKSRQGLDASETPRDISFCGHAILGTEVFVVADAATDPRFADNPLVLSAPNIRFYAGAPLTLRSGERVGTLCAIDRQPKQVSGAQMAALQDLAACVVEEMERVLQRQEFEKSAQLVQSIVETVIDGIITIDSNGTVQSFNSAAERLFGYSPTEVIGKNVKLLMPQSYAAEHDGYLSHYRETREPRVIGIGREVVGQRKDGTVFPMDLAVSEMQQPGQTLFVGIVRDITERKRIEQMKIEFVSTVSHELRTPLTSVSGALGLVCGGALGPVSEQAKTMLDIAYKNSQRLTHLINDLLDMEKLAAGKMRFDLETVELMPLIVQSIESIRAYTHQYQVNVVLGSRLDGAQVRVDGSRLVQVLSNFLSNAAKFSPQGGQVDINVSQVQSNVRVAVQDHGPGITEEFAGRIFQKFSQADSSDTRQKGGTGLGLAISKELIEHMNGAIGFNSSPGQGACFYFELPLCVVNQATPEPIKPRRPNMGHLLVVEDDADVAALLTQMLERAGYSADVASTSELALHMLERGSYAAMTLDLLMPNQSGMTLIRKLRSRDDFEKLPIIVVSAFADGGQLGIKGDFAAVDWLDKPIDEDQLIAAVRRSQRASPNHQLKILHVEDDSDLHHIVATLGRDIAAFDKAPTLAQARKKLGCERYDLVILDIGLPDGSGFSLLPEIHALQPAPLVIVLSGAELSLEEQQTVHQVLVKSRTSTENLINTIQRSIASAALKPRDGHHET